MTKASVVPIPRPIANHGVIGNLSTMALVATDGAIDFLCWPCFDSPSIFAALLDPEKGGVYELAPDLPGARTVQMYLPETNVLMTRWLCEEASVEIVDMMPMPYTDGACPTRVVRQVKVTRGEVTMRLRCAPRFDYGRAPTKVSLRENFALFSSPGHPTLRLSGPARFERGKGEVTGEVRLRQGESVEFVLEEDGVPMLSSHDLHELARYTIRYWQDWASRSTYKGHWREAVTRSALVLKLMTSIRHGSIVAAATFGLPEVEGGERNWDYRAVWIRDASFTVYALMRLGYQNEASAFYRWLGERASKSSKTGVLRIMYALDGSIPDKENVLDHFAGYGGAVPVRIGNDAIEQIQLDIYGELLDSIYLSNKYGEAISHEDWAGVRRVVDHVCRNWKRADAGIWEIRSKPRHHLHSRLMCWVAVDRAIRLATKRSLAAPFTTWIRVRNAIHEDIWSSFWNEDVGHFVQSKGSTELDGALLLMPLVRFVSATDPKWLATLDAIGEKLGDDGLVYRYRNEDGLDGEEGAFAACSFWYVECLARAGRLDEARLMFEKLLHYANHLHLYAEEFDVRARLVGNFPQAFTHLALISAAYYLDRQLDGRAKGEWQG
ncbi:glycoside hydrolase family 15 protein [uncultured Oxalicibacterium sp.]|uniref:glycoside hydrolase family 15 protein n=1 Tax=uncultured Oxalicibacterium sp. TaxID=1168540 RepID=UPI0025F0D317|nr:glycoside hydrolase family 15 protein [uncultured Oxalicibacterium sp.]